MAAPAPMPPPTYGTPPPMPPPAYGMPPPMMMPQERTGLPIAGGALLIVAGVLGLIMWAWVLSIGALFVGIPGLGDPGGIVATCGAIGIIFSIFPLIGGIFAVQRKMWGLGVAGGVLGIFSFGFVIGSILALIGLILVAVSRKEFP